MTPTKRKYYRIVLFSTTLSSLLFTLLYASVLALAYIMRVCCDGVIEPRTFFWFFRYYVAYELCVVPLLFLIAVLFMIRGARLNYRRVVGVVLANLIWITFVSFVFLFTVFHQLCIICSLHRG